MNIHKNGQAKEPKKKKNKPKQLYFFLVWEKSFFECSIFVFSSARTYILRNSPWYLYGYLADRFNFLGMWDSK